MTTYYVRTDGSNSNAGTSSSTSGAWQTIAKALGASGISSGDTVYIAPGTYREAVTVAMTSAVAETNVIGDVAASQFSDLAGGVVRWTSYTTNDTTAPSGGCLSMTSKDYLTFTDIWFHGSANLANGVSVTTSENVTFRRCRFQLGRRNYPVLFVNAAANLATNLLVDSCVLHGHAGNGTAEISVPTSASADYDCEIKFQNCIIGSIYTDCVYINASGADAFKGGGIKIHNCRLEAGGKGVSLNSANLATSSGNECEVYNSLISALTGVSASTSGQLLEDYNRIYASTTHTNVTAGGNSVYSSTDYTHADMYECVPSLWGLQSRPSFEPSIGSPILGRGTSGSVSLTTDMLGRPRPSGGASASKSWGPLERGNTFAKETGTVRTGSNAISITGPGTQDFQLPVNAVSTTVTCYVRWDATYAGTKPQMKVLNCEEAGVTAASTTATGSSGAWEQLSLNFTPTRAGIVTIRLQSNDTNGGGKMFADDFAVA